MKIFATVVLMISLVCGSFAVTATDAQAHRAARPHRHVIIWERPGARRHRHVAADRHHRHAVGHHRRVAARERHRAHRAEARHHHARACKTVLYHGAWVKRC